MDLFTPNPFIIKKLLQKRQNPITHSNSPQTNNLQASKPTSKASYSGRQHSDSAPHPHANFCSYTFPIVQFNASSVIVTGNSNNSHDSDSNAGSNDDEGAGGGGGGSNGDREPAKKRKLNPDIKVKKNNCYEDEADQSTACETNSDGQSNEFSDYFSPQMGYQTYKDMKFEEFKLDDETDSLNQSFKYDSPNYSSDEESMYIREANERIKPLDGKCLGIKVKDGEVIVMIKCKFGHSWETQFSQINSSTCSKCSENLKRLAEFAASNGGKIMNETFQETISYFCKNGHQWNVSHKNAQRHWCSSCQKSDKDQMRRQLEEARNQREKEQEIMQQKLFEQARLRAEANSCPNASNSNMNMNYQCYQNVQQAQLLEYLKRVDYQIESLAKKYTNDYMISKEYRGECDYQQILQVYKIIIMPNDILQTYMLNLSAEGLKAEFRRLAKLIHPDKNKHPQSVVAFQKIHKIYEGIVGRLE